MSWLEADLDLAVAAARAAGDVVMKAFRTKQEVSHKGPDQPLTQADLASDAVLKERLLGARPSYGWLSEETADTAARLRCERIWVVDPIDGSVNAKRGIPFFSLSIAVADGPAMQDVAFGFVHDFGSGEEWTADGLGLALDAGDRRDGDGAGRRGRGNAGGDRDR